MDGSWWHEYFQFVPDSGTSWNELEMAKLKEQTELFLTNAGYPILWDKRNSFFQIGFHGLGTFNSGEKFGDFFEKNEI